MPVMANVGAGYIQTGKAVSPHRQVMPSIGTPCAEEQNNKLVGGFKSDIPVRTLGDFSSSSVELVAIVNLRMLLKQSQWRFGS
jgi:hypothetical protein